MNLKPNLWTLLFLLAAAVLVYTQLRPSASPEPDTALSPIAVSDSIPTEQAQQMIINYMQKFEMVLNDSMTQINGKSVLDTTGVVAVPVYFRLQRNEIAEIFNHFGGQQVYAVLGLLPGTRGARDTIDLLLSDVEPNQNNIFLQGTFYDFATPCPPLCE